MSQTFSATVTNTGCKYHKLSSRPTTPCDLFCCSPKISWPKARLKLGTAWYRYLQPNSAMASSWVVVYTLAVLYYVSLLPCRQIEQPSIRDLSHGWC